MLFNSVLCFELYSKTHFSEFWAIWLVTQDLDKIFRLPTETLSSLHAGDEVEML